MDHATHLIFMSSDKSSDKPADKNSSTPVRRPGLQGHIEENLPTVVVAVLLAIGVRWFVAEPRYIPSSSMEPTLQINDRLIIEKVSYHFRQPQRGEIVVFYPPNNPVVPDSSKVYIKRVIGLPGDRISIQNGKVYVNEKSLTEPYIAEPPAYNLPTDDPNQCLSCFRPQKVERVGGILSFTVPPQNYWVMGDNRNDSLDSHAWGFMPASNLVGHAFFRYWPPDQRIGQLTTPQY